MSGIPPWESELCEATQVVWVSSSEDELFAATHFLQSTFDNIHVMLGSGPAERPPRTFSVLDTRTGSRPLNVYQELLPVKLDLEVGPRSVPQDPSA